jgi:hypothetical protein
MRSSAPFSEKHATTPSAVATRRQRVVAEVIDGARRFDLFSRRAVQQQLVANVRADDVIDECAHVPLGTRCRSPPVIGSDESQPPCELVVGDHEQLERVS